MVSIAIRCSSCFAFSFCSFFRGDVLLYGKWRKSHAVNLSEARFWLSTCGHSNWVREGKRIMLATFPKKEPNEFRVMLVQIAPVSMSDSPRQIRQTQHGSSDANYGDTSKRSPRSEPKISIAISILSYNSNWETWKCFSTLSPKNVCEQLQESPKKSSVKFLRCSPLAKNTTSQPKHMMSAFFREKSKGMEIGCDERYPSSKWISYQPVTKQKTKSWNSGSNLNRRHLQCSLRKALASGICLRYGPKARQKSSSCRQGSATARLGAGRKRLLILSA